MYSGFGKVWATTVERRNLHRGGRRRNEPAQREIPDSYAQLLTISGIGPYTAAAISSIVFGEAQAVCGRKM